MRSPRCYTRFLKRFIDDHPLLVASLKAALDEQDFKTGVRLTHTLKGLAATLGIQSLVTPACVSTCR